MFARISIISTHQLKKVEKKAFIMLIRPCNLDPLESNYFTVNLDCTGVYIGFLFLLQNIDWDTPSKYQQSVLGRNENDDIRLFHLKNVSFAAINIGKYCITISHLCNKLRFLVNITETSPYKSYPRFPPTI